MEKYPTLKAFLIAFAVQGHTVQQYKKSTQPPNFGQLPTYPGTSHIQKYVKSWTKRLCTIYKIPLKLWHTIP